LKPLKDGAIIYHWKDRLRDKQNKNYRDIFNLLKISFNESDLINVKPFQEIDSFKRNIEKKGYKISNFSGLTIQEFCHIFLQIELLLYISPKK
jgi:hypothetical protein